MPMLTFLPSTMPAARFDYFFTPDAARARFIARATPNIYAVACCRCAMLAALMSTRVGCAMRAAR